jgi:tetratricopeptide (TPR) repeat protein
LQAKHHSRVVLIAMLSLWVSAAYGGSLPPGVVRQSNGVYLVENHSSAGMLWHRTGQRGATVIHLDAHDDCRFVAAKKLERLAKLKRAGQWDRIFRLSDLSYVSGFKVRPEDTLFDLGNFIYPCMADGTVSRFIWVLPDLTLDDAARARLKGHLVSALHLKAPAFTDQADGSFSFALLKGTMVVTTLAALPPQPKGAILDLDIDFFAFPRALTDIHIKGDLQWDPEAVCERLVQLVPDPALTTISASVYGGYLPLIFRFMADACFDQLVTGAFPPYARQHLDVVLKMRRASTPVPAPPAPTNPIYRPAHQHLKGMLQLMQRDMASAMTLMEAAASNSPIYAKALLDASEALRHMGYFEAASESVQRFEDLTGHSTTESRSEHVHVLRGQGQQEEAEAVVRELTQWNPDPHLLLLHGGVLTELQRYTEAREVYLRILTMHPQDHLAAYNLAYIEELQGNADDAILHYRQAIALRDNFAAAHENVGYLLARQKRFREALEHLEHATSISPKDPGAWAGLGDVQAVLGALEQAKASYERALLLQTDGPEATHARDSLKRLAEHTKQQRP